MRESEIIASTIFYMLKSHELPMVAKGNFPLWVTETILRVARTNLFLSIQSQTLLMGYGLKQVMPLKKNSLNYDVCDMIKKFAQSGGYVSV